MTEARYWLVICEHRIEDGYPSLVQDPWCRRTLCEAAAYDPVNCGVDGTMWHFADDSKLIATPRGVRVLEPTGAKR